MSRQPGRHMYPIGIWRPLLHVLGTIFVGVGGFALMQAWCHVAPTASRGDQPVQRARHTATAAVQHMRVDHGCRNVRVPKQFLHRANVVPGLKKVRCKRMTQSVGRDGLEDAGARRRRLDCSLDALLIDMVTAYRPRTRIDRRPLRSKNILPAERCCSGRIFSCQRVRQPDVAPAIDDIRVMLRLALGNLQSQWLDKLCSQHRYTVFSALAIPDSRTRGGPDRHPSPAGATLPEDANHFRKAVARSARPHDPQPARVPPLFPPP